MKYKTTDKTRSTGIEWTDHTWNPFVGCSIKSDGCRNCYAMALAGKLEKWGNPIYKGLTKEVRGQTIWTGKIRRNSEAAFNKPLTFRDPQIFFVNSMSDFFHDNASDEIRIEALDLMKGTRHQYQILTKRPELVSDFFRRTKYVLSDNVWLGATVEDYKVSERIDAVRKFPSVIKFLSIEPLIGPMGTVSYEGIDWAITGGESGPNSRPTDPDWLREIRDGLNFYDVPHFFKQWGRPENNPIFYEAPKGKTGTAWIAENDPVGKGGSKLDGRYFKEMPNRFKVAEY